MNTGRRIVVLVSLILMTAMAGIICQDGRASSGSFIYKSQV